MKTISWCGISLKYCELGEIATILTLSCEEVSGSVRNESVEFYLLGRSTLVRLHDLIGNAIKLHDARCPVFSGIDESEAEA